MPVQMHVRAWGMFLVLDYCYTFRLSVRIPVFVLLLGCVHRLRNKEGKRVKNIGSVGHPTSTRLLSFSRFNYEFHFLTIVYSVRKNILSYPVSKMEQNEQLETCMMREKIANLKLVIRENSQLLVAERAKNAGMDTVTTLLCETQKELKTCQKQKKALEAAVKNLQNRLMMNNLPYDLSLEESDVYIASLCPQTLENLAGQNVRLKNLLHQHASTQEINEMNRTQDVLDELRGTISRLSQENEHLEKEMELIKNSEKSDECKGTEVETSYGQNVAELQMALQTVVNGCQDLGQKLAKAKDKNSVSPRTEHSSSMTERGNGRELSPKLEREIGLLKEENENLQRKLEDVSSMNKMWQDYNSQREEHIRSLKSQLQELHSQPVERPEVSSALKNAFDKIRQLELGKEKAEADAVRLQGMVGGLNDDLLLKETMIKALHEEKKTIGQRLQGQQDVDVLMAQIQVCTEDFENERRDRVRAQSELTNTKVQLNQMKKELDRYRILNQAPRNPNNQQFYNQASFGNQVASQQPLGEQQLSSRGRHSMHGELMPDCASLNFNTESEVSKEKFKSLPAPSNDTVEILCCPKCGKDFAEGCELLSHIESCVE